MDIIDRVKKRVYGGDNFINFSDFRYLPRWVILLIDTSLLLASIVLAYYLLPFFKVSLADSVPIELRFMMILLVNISFFFILKTYAGTVRHSTFTDLLKILLSSFFTFVVIISIHFGYQLITGKKFFTLVFLGSYFINSVILLFLFRIVVKESFKFLKLISRSALSKNLLVLGVDDMSVSLASAIIENSALPYNVKGFLTEREDSTRAKFLGKPTYSKATLEKYSKEELDIDGVIFIRENLTKEETNYWVNFFLEKDMQIFKAPTVKKLRGNTSFGTIVNLQIEDLLNRKPIKVDNTEVKERHYNRAVLVTGGAGSIGSEIVRQVALFSPSLLVVLDQAETPLYEIELEMKEKFPDVNFEFILADVRDEERLEYLFNKYHFSMVYHAAAYKHVPLVEENPCEGILVNVIGSKHVADLASKYKVNRFVMVSTDKAVNPTNVMGASKRAAELYVQSLQTVEGNETKFITTRFGNVLGSNGSVIPHFKKQIEKGGPITITHKDIVRYFMMIPEACDLVLQAGAMGSGGEIYIFDMGEPVKILDLAKRMIKLSGLEPDVDIEIVFTGLRSGEKLYEELLSDDSKTLPTHHDKILISKDPLMKFEDINHYLWELKDKSKLQDKYQIVKILKKIVPEFKSNNSIYTCLDSSKNDNTLPNEK